MEQADATAVGPFVHNIITDVDDLRIREWKLEMRNQEHKRAKIVSQMVLELGSINETSCAVHHL